MHPFVKENREGYKRNRKNPPYHTAHLSNATKRLAWLFFNSQTFCVKRHPKEEEKKRASDFWARKKDDSYLVVFFFKEKKLQFFGGQHKCFYKECSVAEATQYDKSPWWVEMRVISLKKKKTFSMTLCCHSTKNPRYKMSDFHSIPRALQSGLDKKASVQ